VHGLRRSNADKREAVAELLRDGEWAAWSDSEIGRRCRVNHVFIAKMRKQLARPHHEMFQDEQPRIGTPARPTEWLGISDSNFDVQRENSSL
jgi:hypothetical protein